MEDILLRKTKEVMTELRNLLSEDKISENHKNFVLGELAILIELLESKSDCCIMTNIKSGATATYKVRKQL